MFRDINHLTTVAADWFTPMIEAVVMPPTLQSATH